MMGKFDGLPLPKRRSVFSFAAYLDIILTGYVVFGAILATTIGPKSWYAVFGVFVLALIAYPLEKEE